MADETPTARILRDLDVLKLQVQGLDRDQQQRLALLDERINGRLALIEQTLTTAAARIASLESGRQWVLRTIGGVAIGGGITAIWALGSFHR